MTKVFFKSSLNFQLFILDFYFVCVVKEIDQKLSVTEDDFLILKDGTAPWWPLLRCSFEKSSGKFLQVYIGFQIIL